MITKLKQLSQKLRLDLENIMDDRLRKFPLLVPASFVSRINPQDLQDPLLLQVLPRELEFKTKSGFNSDPLQEKKQMKIPGLVHKYSGRVLLLVTKSCVVHCRYCFRRHLHNQITNWQSVVAYIKNDRSINEVILSGGDPLMLAPQKLKKIIALLTEIPQLKRVRIHSRVPIVLPEKVDLQIFKAKLPIILMVHCNHPQELSIEVSRKLKKLQAYQVPIFNQAVLLKGINDDSQTQIALSEKLFDAGVIPCYLHLLDQVAGAAHFYVTPRKARLIYSKMRVNLPSYLLPKLVKEVGGQKICL